MTSSVLLIWVRTSHRLNRNCGKIYWGWQALGLETPQTLPSHSSYVWQCNPHQHICWKRGLNIRQQCISACWEKAGSKVFLSFWDFFWEEESGLNRWALDTCPLAQTWAGDILHDAEYYRRDSRSFTYHVSLHGECKGRMTKIEKSVVGLVIGWES